MTSCLGEKSAHGPGDRRVPTLQDVQADSTEFVNVGVVDLGQESDLWRCHGVVVWQEELELEYSSCDGSVWSSRQE